MRSTRSRLFAALVAPLLVVALAGCGGDESGSDDKAGGSSAGDAAPDGLSAGDEVEPDEFIALMQDAMAEPTTMQTEMTMTASGIEITSSGAIDYTTTPPSMALSMTMPMLGDQPIDMRVIDGKAYMNMGDLTQNKFVVGDLDDPDSPLGDMSTLTDSMDPVHSFDAFNEGLEKVVYEGQEDVDGDSLAHYTLTLDTTKVSMLDTLGASADAVPDSLEYDAWLDSDDRRRKVTLTMGDTASVEINVSAWGEPVTIEAPPADEITDAEMGGLGG